MGKISHPQLRKAISAVTKHSKPSTFPAAWRLLIWEVMRAVTRIQKLEVHMDKMMHKVTEKMKMAEKDVKKGKPKAAVKVLEKAEKKNEMLVKMDKKRDKIIEKAKRGKR